MTPERDRFPVMKSVAFWTAAVRVAAHSGCLGSFTAVRRYSVTQKSGLRWSSVQKRCRGLVASTSAAAAVSNSGLVRSLSLDAGASGAATGELSMPSLADPSGSSESAGEYNVGLKETPGNASSDAKQTVESVSASRNVPGREYFDVRRF